MTQTNRTIPDSNKLLILCTVVWALGLAYLLCENWYSRSSIWQICCILNTLKYNKSYFFVCVVHCVWLSFYTFTLTILPIFSVLDLSLWLLAWYIYARKMYIKSVHKSDMKPGLSYTIARVVKMVKHYFSYPRKIVETDIVSNVLLFIIAEYK